MKLNKLLLSTALGLTLNVFEGNTAMVRLLEEMRTEVVAYKALGRTPAQFQQLDADLQTAHATAFQSAQDLQQAHRQVAEKEQLVRSLQAQLGTSRQAVLTSEAARATVADASVQVSGLDEGFVVEREQLTSLLKEKEVKLGEQNQFILSERKKHESTLEAMAQELLQEQQRIAAVQEEKTLISQQVAKALEASKKIEKSTKSLEESTRILQKQFDQVKENRKSLSAEIDRLKQEKNDAAYKFLGDAETYQTTLNGLETEFAETKSLLEKESEERKELEQAKVKLEARFQAEVLESRTTHAQSLKSIEEQQKIVTTLQVEKRDLEQRFALAQEATSAIQDVSAGDADYHQARLEMLEQELAQTKDLLQKALEEKTVLEEAQKKTASEESLFQDSEALERLKAELSEKEQELLDLETKRLSSEKESEKLLGQKELEIEELQHSKKLEQQKNEQQIKTLELGNEKLLGEIDGKKLELSQKSESIIILENGIKIKATELLEKSQTIATLEEELLQAQKRNQATLGNKDQELLSLRGKIQELEENLTQKGEEVKEGKSLAEGLKTETLKKEKASRAHDQEMETLLEGYSIEGKKSKDKISQLEEENEKLKEELMLSKERLLPQGTPGITNTPAVNLRHAFARGMDKASVLATEAKGNVESAVSSSRQTTPARKGHQEGLETPTTPHGRSLAAEMEAASEETVHPSNGRGASPANSSSGASSDVPESNNTLDVTPLMPVPQRAEQADIANMPSAPGANLAADGDDDLLVRLFPQSSLILKDLTKDLSEAKEKASQPASASVTPIRPVAAIMSTPAVVESLPALNFSPKGNPEKRTDDRGNASPSSGVSASSGSASPHLSSDDGIPLESDASRRAVSSASAAAVELTTPPSGSGEEISSESEDSITAKLAVAPRGKLKVPTLVITAEDGATSIVGRDNVARTPARTTPAVNPSLNSQT